jgi:uncharacterized protein
MPDSLSAPMRAVVHDHLIPVDKIVWENLFSSHPDSPELIHLVEQSGMEGFTFKNLALMDNDHIILLLPLFIMRLDLKNFVEGPPQKIVSALAPFLPFLLRPRILGIGFVEGEWGAVGISPTATREQLQSAWSVALAELNRIARQNRAGLLLFLNFTEQTTRLFPPDQFARYAPIPTYPCARVPLPFNDVAEYLATLSKNARRDIRRKMMDAGDIRIERTRDPAVNLDTIYHLYKKTVERAEMSFGVQRRTFFEQVCADVPGAEYVLYFLGDKLIAMNLLVQRGDALVDKYFAMDESLGREHNLYFVSWIENIRYCIENKIAVYHAGPGAEATKARLGSEFLASITMFHHRNPIAHALLSRLRGLLAYEPAVKLPPAKLGAAWNA